MANYCEGTLRLRGKYSDLVRFFKEGLDYSNMLAECSGEYDSPAQTMEDILQEDEDCLTVNISRRFHTAWIKNTQGAFVREASVLISNKGEEKVSVAIRTAEAKWSWKIEDLLWISEEFHLDIAIVAYECGMEFKQDICVLYGSGIHGHSNVLRSNTFHYEDFVWECESPCLGG